MVYGCPALCAPLGGPIKWAYNKALLEYILTVMYINDAEYKSINFSACLGLCFG